MTSLTGGQEDSKWNVPHNWFRVTDRVLAKILAFRLELGCCLTFDSIRVWLAAIGGE